MLNLKKLVGIAAVGLVSSIGFAQQNTMVKPAPVTQMSQFKPHIGVLLGASQPEYSGITASEVAVDIGYQPYIPFGLGAEISHARIDSGQGPDDRNTILIKASYHLGGSIAVIRDSYLGLGVGAVFKPYGTSLVAAPMIGFDIPVADMQEGRFSLGANLKAQVIGDEELDTTTLSGVVKYWY